MSVDDLRRNPNARALVLQLVGALERCEEDGHVFEQLRKARRALGRDELDRRLTEATNAVMREFVGQVVTDAMLERIGAKLEEAIRGVARECGSDA